MNYVTSDTPFAAALLAYGYVLKRIQPSDSERLSFELENVGSEYTPEDLRLFFESKKLVVDALSFWQYNKYLNNEVKRFQSKTLLEKLQNDSRKVKTTRKRSKNTQTG